MDNLFPYAFGDWGNFDFNIALYCCFCDIVGVSRPDYGSTVKSGDVEGPTVHAMELHNNAQPLEVSVRKPELGRFGSVIYR